MYNIGRSELTEVFYTNVKMNEMDSERVKMMVDIYEDTERIHDLRANTETQQQLQYTDSISVKSRKQRAVEVCCRLLCALLLMAIIALCVYFTIQRKLLLTHITNLNEERDQILKRNNNLTEERDQIPKNNNNLTKEREQILKRNNNLTEERRQILKRNNNLTKEREQFLIMIKSLTAEKEDLQIKNKNVTEEKEKIKNKFDKLHGVNEKDQRANNFKWIHFNLSFYYISSEKKSWNDSKLDCRQRGADLAIIRSREEYDFLQKMPVSANLWVGLKKKDDRWKWIDGTTVSDWLGTLHSENDDYKCALMTSSGRSTEKCTNSNYWICKITIGK